MSEARPLYITEQSELPLDALIAALNQLKSIPSTLSFGRGTDFLVQLLAGICSDHPITLLDSDLGTSEVSDLQSSVDTQQLTVSLHIDSPEALLDRIQNSSAEIGLFTSGTTGQPKLIRHPVQRFVDQTKSGGKFQDDVWAWAYNPTHMAGLQVLFQALLNLNPLVYVFGQPPAIVSKRMLDHRVTHISATPTFFNLLLAHQATYPGVRHVTLGGEKASEALYDRLASIFPNARLTNIYASTEAGSLFASRNNVFEVPDDLADRVKIDNDELMLHPTLLGTNVSDESRWYATGDLVEVMEENPLRFRFVGRRSETVNVGGLNVYPLEVAETLHGHPDVLDAHVFAKSNSVLGNLLCANVVAKPGSELSEKTLLDYLKDKLAPHKIPRIIKMADHIPMSRTGKKTAQ